MAPTNSTTENRKVRALLTNKVILTEVPKPAKNKDPKRKHSSSMKAASLARSAVDHVHPHRINGLTSRFTHTGTNPSFENK